MISFQLRKKILEKSKEGSLKSTNGEIKSAPKKRGRWDQTVDEVVVPNKKKTLSVSTNSGAVTPVWDADVSTFLFGFLLLQSRKFRNEHLKRFFFFLVCICIPCNSK
jgi:hypothetical protein